MVQAQPELWAASDGTGGPPAGLTLEIPSPFPAAAVAPNVSSPNLPPRGGPAEPSEHLFCILLHVPQCLRQELTQHYGEWTSTDPFLDFRISGLGTSPTMS